MLVSLRPFIRATGRSVPPRVPRMGGVGQRVHKPLLGVADTNHLLSIAKHDPNVNAKQVVGVCNTQ